MIEINLLPEALREREMTKPKLPDIPEPRSFVIAFVIFFCLQLLISMFALYQRIEILGVRHQIASLKKENKEILHRKAEMAFMEDRIKQIESITKRKFFWSSLLNVLSHSMTKGVWLREFSIMNLDIPASDSGAKDSKTSKRGSQNMRCLKLEGSAIGQGQETSYIGKYIKGLKEGSSFGEFFSQIELSNINQRKIKDFDVYDFELVCVFKKEKV